MSTVDNYKEYFEATVCTSHWGFCFRIDKGTTDASYCPNRGKCGGC